MFVELGNEPVGSGCVGQVYRGVVREGEELVDVAVKVTDNMITYDGESVAQSYVNFGVHVLLGSSSWIVRNSAS